MEIYRVKRGDTLSEISRLSGVPLGSILANNGFSVSQTLAVGQTVVLLRPLVTYEVKRGDTLFSVGERFGLSRNELFRNNPQLRGQNTLTEGQTLFIEYEGEKRETVKISGYAYDFANLDLLRLYQPYLTYLMPFTYGFTSEGELISPNDEPLLALAGEFETTPLLHLSTLTESGTFSNELAGEILNNALAREKLVENVINVISEKGYGGLDIDFEFLPVSDREKYVQLIGNFRNRLADTRKIVVTALAPKTSAEQRGLLYEGHDYRKIGEASDLVFLMTYEWGYTYGRLCHMYSPFCYWRGALGKISTVKFLLSPVPFLFFSVLRYVAFIRSDLKTLFFDCASGRFS